MKPSWISLYGRLLRFLRPHLGGLAGAVLFMAGFAAFSSFTLAMIVPFTEIVLSGHGPEELARRHGLESRGGVGEAPDSSLDRAGDRAGAPDSSLDRAGDRANDQAGELARKGLDLRRRLETTFYGWIRGEDRTATLHRFALALLLIFLVKNLLWYGQSYLIVRVEQSVVRDIRNAVFRHYQDLSLDFFSRHHSGTLISRITNDIDLVKGAIANGIADLLRQSLLLLAYLVTVLLASWQLFLFAILVLPPNLWLIDRVGHVLRRSSRVSQTRMARLTAVLSETLGGIRIVKGFGLEGQRVRRFAEETQGYAETMVRMTRIGSLATPLTEMLGVFVAVAILWFAGSRFTGEGGASGRFLLFIIGMLSMMQPIKVLSQVNIRIQQGLAAAARIFEVLDEKPKVVDAPAAAPLESFQREIRLEGVSFAYHPGIPVLHDIHLTVRRGEVVALVGPSGGGKSTLVDLLPRFHDPTEGRITIDGRDLRSVRLADLRRLIGLVTQETILFEGTIRENLVFARPEATTEEVEAAARAANAHEFIARLPEGYNAWIGERGLLLSGGQRQRLAIARAILKNPAILIFDEATSALDSESEKLVQEAIDRLLTGRTAVVIAHRLSTVRHADRIVVLAEGRIVQEGRHEALLAEGGLYRRLYEMQFREPTEGPEVVVGPP